MDKNLTMEKLVNLCKARGFVFQGSEIYGGFANTWDFGPVGVELKNNIKKAWWKRFVQEDPMAYGVDAAILMNPRVWEASGHVQSFSDPQLDCKSCKYRFRADNLIEEKFKDVDVERMTTKEMEDFINEHKIKCPHCGNFNWTPIRQFKLMFETSRGTVEGEKDIVYLRPETCQGEYVNFMNVQRTMRAKVPFAIAQIGKSFRNEITPGNFLFRTVEFEQMELQMFCHPNESMDIYNNYKERAMKFVEELGLTKDNLRFHDHEKLAHYAKAACDIQYQFPIGWQELNGIHHRGDWDLSRHSEFSGKNMEYLDPYTNEKYLPNVIEYSEITDEMAEATDENGELLYGESHILCNLFSIDAIERMGAEPLPYHVAYKKAKYIDKDGNLVEPDSPNAYKFEAFLFDAFESLDDMAILRVKREEEFAPVKNAEGVDSPETARALYKAYHKI